VVVDTVDLGAQDKGRRSFEWDAAGYSGNAADLRFRVRATSGETAVTATGLSEAQVVATGSNAGALTLTLDNGDIVNYFRIHSVL